MACNVLLKKRGITALSSNSPLNEPSGRCASQSLRHVWQSSKQPKPTWRGARTGTSRRPRLQNTRPSPINCGPTRSPAGTSILTSSLWADVESLLRLLERRHPIEGEKARALEELRQILPKTRVARQRYCRRSGAPEGSSVTVPKAPFTDEELNRIFAACDAIGIDGIRPNRRNWAGEDVKDFILLSIYTGMRISDVATFDISKRLSGNSVFLRMHKTRKPLYTWIPDWLVVRLRARQQKHGSLIFRCGVTLNMKQLTDIWRNGFTKYSIWPAHLKRRQRRTASGTPSFASSSRKACRSPMSQS
jgi:integrase